MLYQLVAGQVLPFPHFCPFLVSGRAFLLRNLAAVLFVKQQQSLRVRCRGHRVNRRGVRAVEWLETEAQWGVKDG